jgi:glutathione S-transferase
MQLIGMLDSPYVRRVAVTLLAAKVPFTHRPIYLFRQIDEFVTLNPPESADARHRRGDSADGFERYSRISRRGSPTSCGADANAASPRVVRSSGDGNRAHRDGKGGVEALRASASAPDKQHEAWIDRVMSQLAAGLAALDAELPRSGWICGELGIGDISVVCAVGFLDGILSDVADMGRYTNVASFCARAEALPAFRTAPALDGAIVQVDLADS